MWTERVVIVVQSLHRDFLPSAWQMYYPTVWDWATLAGTLGLFFSLFYLFIRVLPMISIHEVQSLVKGRRRPGANGGGTGGAFAGYGSVKRPSSTRLVFRCVLPCPTAVPWEVPAGEDPFGAASGDTRGNHADETLWLCGGVRGRRRPAWHAARAAQAAGYRKMNAYSPFSIEGLSEAVGMKRNVLPWIVLCGGFGGAGLGYYMQWYASVVSYPLNIGGRPYHSWPSFIPITFELGILSASLTAFFASCC